MFACGGSCGDPECTKSYASKAVLKAHKQRWKCTVCGNEGKGSIGRHMKTHNGPTDDRFACPICGEVKLRKDHLVSHMKTHSEERKYVCSDCGAAFKDSSTLKEHVQRMHTTETFECDECQKSFPTQHDLTAHKVWHLSPSEWKHECGGCGQKFPRASELTRHYKTHAECGATIALSVGDA